MGKVFLLGAGLLGAALLLGCDQAGEVQPGTRAAIPAAGVSAPIVQQALAAAQSSPEEASRLAAGAPEATSLAAAVEAERIAAGAAAAPESSMARVTAIANLAAAAARAAPQSTVAQTAAEQAGRARDQVGALVKAGASK